MGEYGGVGERLMVCSVGRLNSVRGCLLLLCCILRAALEGVSCTKKCDLVGSKKLCADLLCKDSKNLRIQIAPGHVTSTIISASLNSQKMRQKSS